MCRSMLGIGGLALGSLLSSQLAAAELNVESRLAAGVSYYNLDLDGAIVVGDDSLDDVDYSDWLYVVGGGLTFAYDRFFIDLYGQYSFNGNGEVDLDIVVGDVAIDDLAQDVEFNRIETALTVGYRVTDQFAAFVGFRYADVNFDSGSSLGAVAADFSTDFNQKGPFVGASYVVPAPVLKGAFVVNAAVAYLDGDLESELDVSAPFDDVVFDADGDAIGINAGASWVTSLTNEINLSIGADVSLFNFDDETDVDESITRLRTELRYSF